jgi:sodium-coupled neutral amino acid transporter 11
MDDDDYMTAEGGTRGSTGHDRAPLLTEIVAPTVRVASADVGFNTDDLLESARPKSGMRSAFMNMANSIM